MTFASVPEDSTLPLANLPKMLIMHQTCCHYNPNLEAHLVSLDLRLKVLFLIVFFMINDFHSSFSFTHLFCAAHPASYCPVLSLLAIVAIWTQAWGELVQWRQRPSEGWWDTAGGEAMVSRGLSVILSCSHACLYYEEKWELTHHRSYLFISLKIISRITASVENILWDHSKSHLANILNWTSDRDRRFIKASCTGVWSLQCSCHFLFSYRMCLLFSSISFLFIIFFSILEYSEKL